eukprot:gene16852-23084_t
MSSISNYNEQIKIYAAKKREEYLKQQQRSVESSIQNNPDHSFNNTSNAHLNLGTNFAQPSTTHRLISSDLSSNSNDRYANTNYFRNICHFVSSILCFQSFRIFTIRLKNHNIPVIIHYLWPWYIMIFSLIAWLQGNSLIALYTFIMSGPILFGSVLIHELGHSYMALHVGGHVSKIVLWPLGGMAYISFFGESSHCNDAMISIAGPLTHFPQAGIWMLLMYLCTGTIQLMWPLHWGYDLLFALFAGAIGIQIALFLFNLIPAYPLDGGRLLGSLLCLFGLERNFSYQITSLVGSFIGWIIFFQSFHVIVHNKSSFFFGWNTLFLSIFILDSCWTLWVLACTHRVDEHPMFYEDISYNGSTTDPSSLRSSHLLGYGSVASRV